MKNTLFAIGTLLIIGCSAETSDSAGSGDEQDLTKDSAYLCKSKDAFAPGDLVVGITNRGQTLVVHRQDGSAPNDSGWIDNAYKPRTNKNFVKFADFDSDNDDDHSLSTTVILVDKAMLSGGAKGSVK